MHPAVKLEGIVYTGASKKQKTKIKFHGTIKFKMLIVFFLHSMKHS